MNGPTRTRHVEKCDKCGIEPLPGEVFAQEALPFARARRLCPACHARYYESLYRLMFLGFLLVGLIGLTVIVAKPQSTLGRGLLYFFIFQVMMFAATVVHELGHAFAGRVLRCHVSGIAIGWFGRIVFRFNLFGFDTIIRSVPLGGLAYVQPGSAKWARVRDFFVVLAGPLSNAALAALFWYPGVTDHLLSVKWEMLGLRGLFVGANLLCVISDLLPAVYESPFGKLPSDGLALLQLGVLRRMPYVPEARQPRNQRWHRIARGLVLLVLALGCIVIISMGVWLAMLLQGEPTAMFAIIAIFGGILAALIWLGLRAWHHERARGLTPAGAHGIAGAFQEELLQRTDPAKLAGFTDLQSKLQSLASESQRNEGDALINSALAKNPNELWLLLCKGAWLYQSGRLLEAAELYRELRTRSDLSTATRISLLADELASRAIVGQTTEVRHQCEELLASGASVTEKTYVLDRLACLPIYEDQATYLDEADRWSREALSLLPNSLTLQGTRGGILVERGQLEEAWPLLNNVVRNSPQDVDQCTGCFYLGLIAKARGDLKAARKFGNRARRSCTIPVFLERISRQLGA